MHSHMVYNFLRDFDLFLLCALAFVPSSSNNNKIAYIRYHFYEKKIVLFTVAILLFKFGFTKVLKVLERPVKAFVAKSYFIGNITA